MATAYPKPKPAKPDPAVRAARKAGRSGFAKSGFAVAVGSIPAASVIAFLTHLSGLGLSNAEYIAVIAGAVFLGAVYVAADAYNTRSAALAAAALAAKRRPLFGYDRPTFEVEVDGAVGAWQPYDGADAKKGGAP